MMEWVLNITYGAKSYALKAVLEYHSAQVMRIRVQGMKSSLLFENNYPFLANTKSKKGVQWKIREGEIKPSNPESARMLVHIFEQLEHYLKKDFPVADYF